MKYHVSVLILIVNRPHTVVMITRSDSSKEPIKPSRNKTKYDGRKDCQSDPSWGQGADLCGSGMLIRVLL